VLVKVYLARMLLMVIILMQRQSNF